MIACWRDPHGDVDHEEVEGVERADIVKDVGISHPQTEEYHQEIKTPKHLDQAYQAKILISYEKQKKKVIVSTDQNF